VSAPDGEGTKHCRQLETPADNYRHQQTIIDTSRQLETPADNYRHQFYANTRNCSIQYIAYFAKLAYAEICEESHSSAHTITLLKKFRAFDATKVYSFCTFCNFCHIKARQVAYASVCALCRIFSTYFDKFSIQSSVIFCIKMKRIFQENSRCKPVSLNTELLYLYFSITGLRATPISMAC